MNYIVVESTEWTYPDRREYVTGSDKLTAFAARGSYATTQILLMDVPDDGILKVSTEGFNAEIYELYPVMVEDNPSIDEESALPHYPERWAPYYIYDCLKPFNGMVTTMDKVSGLYIAIKIPKKAAPGTITGKIKINDITIPVEITVYSAIVPEETLKIIVGYNRNMVAEYHNVKNESNKFEELDTKYLKMLRHMHQNMLYSELPQFTRLKNNKFIFNFEKVEKFINKGLSMGFKYFNLPPIGWRDSWKAGSIHLYLASDIDVMSFEGFCFLRQYFEALDELIKRNGWIIDNLYMGVADEPNEFNEVTFRALCGLVRKLAPKGLKLLDATSYSKIYGSLDVIVPVNEEYDKHMDEFEALRKSGDELWFYVCCGPRREGYINRFMDYPLLSTRYLYWGNYKYDLKGFLHWASNSYQPGQDPFKQNSPKHINTDNVTILPSGDTHIIYPGDDEPWMSMRLETQREAAEEFELLKLLEKSNKPLADEICDTCFRSFKDVEYNPIVFRNAKRKLIEEVSKL